MRDKWQDFWLMLARLSLRWQGYDFIGSNLAGKRRLRLWHREDVSKEYEYRYSWRGITLVRSTKRFSVPWYWRLMALMTRRIDPRAHLIIVMEDVAPEEVRQTFERLIAVRLGAIKRRRQQARRPMPTNIPGEEAQP